MKLSDRVELIEVEASRGPGKAPRRRLSGPEDWGQMKRRVRDALLEELGPKLYAKTKPEELKAVVSENLDKALERAGVSVSLTQRSKFAAEVSADLLGYGPLEQILADPSITEIMCNAYDDVYIERNGKLVHVDIAFSDDAHLRQIIEKIVGTVGRRIDESSPMVDARIPDG